MPRSGLRRSGSALLQSVPWLVAACGTDVAQTAVLVESRGAVDCSAPGALALPQDTIFGDGTEPASPLVGTTYGAGQGPGLYVAARDGFRVYLNGKLVAVSSAPRNAAFVPLSLLPGDNVIAAVVAAKEGTPTAVLQLDELERSYPSDASWKVSSEPMRGYANVGYDDSSWLNATDLGALGTLGACEPGSAFPADSTAHWIGPTPGSGTTAAFRKVIRVTAVGYGASTRGGQGAEPVIANSWEDLVTLASSPDPQIIALGEGVHDFRTPPRDQAACPNKCTNDTNKTWHDVLTGSETCPVPLVTRTRDDVSLDLGSNKTIVGLGRGALLRGVTLNLGTSRNLILRNLALYDVNPGLGEAGDAFSVDSASDVWIDHATTKWISDGMTDLGSAKNVTISWVRYDGVAPDECSGLDSGILQITDASVTVHHTVFDHVGTHAPMVHGLSRVHLFDNLMSDIPGSAVSAACDSQVLMEGNTFQRVTTPTTRSACDTGELGLINAPLGSNYYGEDVGSHRGGDDMEPHDSAVFKPPYEYSVAPAKSEWLNVLARAGAGGPWARPLVLD